MYELVSFMFTGVYPIQYALFDVSCYAGLFFLALLTVKHAIGLHGRNFGVVLTYDHADTDNHWLRKACAQFFVKRGGWGKIEVAY